jgi:hypothetical protein
MSSMDGGSAALEQFVILAKTTTKGSTAALIQQVCHWPIALPCLALPVAGC